MLFNDGVVVGVCGHAVTAIVSDERNATVLL